MESEIATKFLVISDTHGDELSHKFPNSVDVSIHCGDLTEESKLDEFRASIRLLKDVKAPLKPVIAGNHDFTMDVPTFQKKLAEIKPPLSEELVRREYGRFGQARQLFETDEAKAAGIAFLDEVTHRFTLANGAVLTVYASPFTPSLSDWGFQYHPQQEHHWSIPSEVDVVITHGPPLGVLDYTDSRTRAGSSSLFAAIARARPRMHCFGHIHEGWGAKAVTWRNPISDTPSHFTDIDNDQSLVIENLASVQSRKFDSPEVVRGKVAKLRRYEQQGYCKVTTQLLRRGTQTLFVNAAIQGFDDDSQQLPWIVDINLPRIKKQDFLDEAQIDRQSKPG